MAPKPTKPAIKPRASFVPPTSSGGGDPMAELQAKLARRNEAPAVKKPESNISPSKGYYMEKDF